MAADHGVFTLGHSPDPDDAFMFYAIAENKIDLRGYRFRIRLRPATARHAANIKRRPGVR